MMERDRDLIIYHEVDLDGVASAALLVNEFNSLERKYSLAGWTYGKEIPQVHGDVKKVWLVDICFGDKHIEFTKSCTEKGIDVAWFDHHKTSEAYVDEFRKSSYEGRGYTTTIVKTDEKIAACELVYNWLGDYGHIKTERYNKMADLIRYLSAYDSWNKDRFNWTVVMNIQYGMRVRVSLDVHMMAGVLGVINGKPISNPESDLREICNDGVAILTYLTTKNKEECENYSFSGEILGHKAIFMNTLEFNSNTFKNAPNVEEYDVLVPFAVMPNGLVRFSVYKNETNDIGVDCSEIAKQFGGGGHRGAAGFQLNVNSDEFMDFLIDKKIKKPKEWIKLKE